MHFVKQNFAAHTRKRFANIDEASENATTASGFPLNYSQERKNGLCAATFRDETSLLLGKTRRNEG